MAEEEVEEQVAEVVVAEGVGQAEGGQGQDPEIDPGGAMAAFLRKVRVKFGENDTDVLNGLMTNVKNGHFQSLKLLLELMEMSKGLEESPAVAERSFASWLWEEFVKTGKC